MAKIPRYLDDDAPDPYPVGFRLPLALYRRLAAVAKEERRPVNSQLVLFLEQGIEEWENKIRAADGVFA